MSPSLQELSTQVDHYKDNLSQINTQISQIKETTSLLEYLRIYKYLTSESPLLVDIRSLITKEFYDIHNTIAQYGASLNLNSMSTMDLQELLDICTKFNTLQSPKYVINAYAVKAFAQIESTLKFIGLPEKTNQWASSRKTKKELLKAPWLEHIRQEFEYQINLTVLPVFRSTVDINSIIKRINDLIQVRSQQELKNKERENVQKQSESIKQAVLEFIDNKFDSTTRIPLEFLAATLLNGSLISTHDELRFVCLNVEQALTKAVTNTSTEAIHIECCDSCDTYTPGEHRCNCGNRRISMHVEITYFARTNESYVTLNTEAY